MYDIIMVLAMTRLPRTCQTDLSGEIPAAAVDAAMAVSPDGDQYPWPAGALVAALRAVPQTDKPEVGGSRDYVFAEKENYSLCLEALITSLDERIAALTRVLEAPENDPVEMAAARAALARSKAYPQLEEWRPFEEVSTRETYRSVLGGGVLPNEQACVLALYRDLLNGGGPGEAECNTSTGEDTVDKEELRIELEAQKLHMHSYTKYEDPDFEPLSKYKASIYTSLNAARTAAQRMEVEQVRMDCSKSLAGRPAQTDEQDQPEYQLPGRIKSWLQHIRKTIDGAMRVYTSPFFTKAEKLSSLLRLLQGRVAASNIIKSNLDHEREISHLLGLTMGAVTEVRQPVVKQVTAYSPGDNTKYSQPQKPGQKPSKSCTSAPEVEGIRRAMDPPRSLAEMASALGRVLRWREQVLSESHSRHRAHDYEQHFKDVLHGVKFAIKCYLCDGQKCGSHGCIAIQNILVSGSVSEGTEVHVTKYKSRVSGTIVEAFEWVSEDGFAMPHWIDEREERMATGKGEPNDDDAPSAVPFENASDIDFMLLAGPVKWDKGPLTDSGSSNSSESSESSGSEHVGSGTKQYGSDTVQKYDSNRTGSTRPDSSDNSVTLCVEEDTYQPGFVKINQVLRREGDTPVTCAVTFDSVKSDIAAAMKVEKFWKNDRPNIEVTLDGDSIDLVPCLQYSERVSDEFVNRERPSGQPNRDLVKKLSEMPIYLVEKDYYEFRKSFSRLESEVIRSMTKPQRICLVLLKHCAAVMGDRRHDFDLKPLCSYELKTAMMWVCEERAPELWTWDGMLESMRAVLDFLLECAERSALPCYFSPEIDLWKDDEKGSAVLSLQVLLPHAIQLLLAGLLSSSQAPLMRHLLNLPLDAQQMLWCCWKRRVDDPYPRNPYIERKVDPKDVCCGLYPAAVKGRLWSERFLDTFRWESLPARCREPDWFAEHGWDTDSEGEREEHRENKDGEGEEEEEDRKDKDGGGEEEDRKDKYSEGEEDREDKDGAEDEENRKDTDSETAEEGGEAARKRGPGNDEESATTSKKVRLGRGIIEQTTTVRPVTLNQAASLNSQTTPPSISLDSLTIPVSIRLNGPTVPVSISLNDQTAPVSISLNGQTAPDYVSLNDLTVPGSISLNGQTAPVYVSLNGLTVPGSISLDGQTSLVSISLDGLSVPGSISLDALTVPVSFSLDGMTIPVFISRNDQTVPVSFSLNGQTTSYITDLNGQTVPVLLSLNGQTAPDST